VDAEDDQIEVETPHGSDCDGADEGVRRRPDTAGEDNRLIGSR
jgi:hypothetical protein